MGNKKILSVITKDDLYEKYIIEQKPMHVVAKELNINVASVHMYIHKFGIPTRPAHQGFKGRKHSDKAKKVISEKNKGKSVSDTTKIKISQSKIKGGIGHKKKRTDGYIKIYFPDHPKSTSDGYIMEHDLIMECLIGRPLKDDECVHHINERRDDNRKENLKLMTKSEHMSYHMRKRYAQKRGEMTYQ